MSTQIHRDSRSMLLITGFSSVVNYLAGLLMIHLLAPANYSEYASAATLLMLVGVVTTASLQWPIAALLAKKDRAGARRLAVYGGLFAALVTAGVTGFLTSKFATDPALTWTVTAAAAVVSVGNATAGLLQGSSPVRQMAFGRLLETGVRTVLIVAGAFAGSAALSIGGTVAGTGVFAAFAAVVAVRRVRAEQTGLNVNSGSVVGATLSGTFVQGLTVLLINAAALSVVLNIEGASAAIGSYQTLSILTRVPFLVASALTVAMFVPLTKGKFDAGHYALATQVRVGVVLSAAVAFLPLPLLNVLLSDQTQWDRGTLILMSVDGFFGGILGVVSAAVLARSVSRVPILILSVFTAVDLFAAAYAWKVGGAFAMAATDLVVVALAAVAVSRRATRAVPRMETAYTSLTWALVALPLFLISQASERSVTGTVAYIAVVGVAGLLAVKSTRFPKSNARALRVLHLAYEDPRQPGAGGGSVRSREVNTRLAAKGHQVLAVTRDFAGSTSGVVDGVTWGQVRLPLPAPLQRWVQARPFVATIAYFVMLPFAVSRLVRSFNPDVIVDDFGAPFTCLPIRWVTRRPIIGVAQWADAAGKTAQYRLPFHWVERLGLRGQKDIVAVSEDLGASLSVRVPKARVHVLPNGVPAEVSQPRAAVTVPGWNAGRRAVVFLGRLDIEQKGLGVLLQAWASVVAQRPGERLWVVGDGPDEAALKALAVDLGVADSVIFTGRINGSERLDVLGDASLVVMPSTYETFGMVAAEALAVGTPVILSDIPSLREFAAKNAAVVAVTSTDVDGFASAILAGLDDDALHAKALEQVPAIIAEYDWDAVAAGFESLLVNARRDVVVTRHETDEILRKAFPADTTTLVVGNYGANNTGDEAILSRLIDLMADNAAVTVASRNHHAVAGKHGIPAVPLTSGAGVKTWLKAQRVVVGGGGMFGPGQPLMVSLLPAFLVVSRLMGKSVAFAGIGAYPGMPKISRAVLALAGRIADVIVVRDEPATRVLDLPWGPRVIHLIPDAGFGLASDVKAARTMLAEANVDESKPLLLLSPKAGPDSTLTEKMIRAAAHAARVWREKGGQVGILLLSDKGEYGLGRAASDAVLAARIFALSGTPPLVFGPGLDPRVAKGLFAQADAIIASRFHALVFGAAGGVPIASLTFEEKSRALLDLHSGLDVPDVKITDTCLEAWVDQVFPETAHATVVAKDISDLPVAAPVALPIIVPAGVDVLLNKVLVKHPELTIVIPSYNTDVHRLTSTVQRALQVAGPNGEVVVVDDGSTNGSVHAITHLEGPLVILRKENGGKGSALRQGMAVARGSWVGLVDADGQYRPEEIPDLVAAAQKAHTLAAVGQRDLSKAGYTPFRMLTSWAFRMWTRFWINPGVSDTQAGNKVIAGALLPLLLPELAENTFAIDIDILSAFTRLGIIPATAPITFIHDEDSSVTIGRGLQAFVGVVRVKNRHMKALQGSVPAGVLDGQDPASADTIRTGNSQQKEADVNI